MTAGQGTQKSTCGEYTSSFEDCSRVHGHDLAHRKYTCRDPLCPICHYGIAAKEAKKSCKRMKGIKAEWYKDGFNLGDFRHFILSPPKELYHLFYESSNFARLNRQARAYMEEIGVWGGVGAWHRVKGSKSDIKLYKAHQKDLPDGWHFHGSVCMPEGHKINSDKFFDATGWVYKNLAIHNQKTGVFNVLKYEFNHAAIRLADKPSGHNSHIPVWFGGFSYGAAKVEAWKEREVKLCSAQRCKADKHVFFEDYDFDQGEAVKIIEKREYSLTDSQRGRGIRRFSAPPAQVPRPSHITEYSGVIT